MGGDRLTDEEIDIILGHAEFPAYHKDHFKDLRAKTVNADRKITEIRNRIKQNNRALTRRNAKK